MSSPALPWHHRPWLLRIAAVVAAALVSLLAAAWLPGAMKGMEEAVGDLAWRSAASTQVERRVVVVDIDERSVAEVGAWPWPRDTVARLVARLDAAGVAVQALDISFPEAKPGDAELARTLQASKVVLGQVFSLDPTVVPDVGVAAGAVAGECPPGVPQANGLVGNAPSLVLQPLAAGHHTPRVEGDGVVRKIPALICHRGKPYVTLALAALARAAAGDRPAAAVAGPAGPAVWQLQSALSAGARFSGAWMPAQWLSSPLLPGIQVPLDEAGDLRVPYGRKREALLSLSAADVLAGRADTAMLQGAIVFVGATAFGIGDTVATPLSSVAGGVEVHAQLTAGLLDDRLVHTPTGASQIEAGLAGLAALLLLGLTALRRGRAGAGGTPASGAGSSSEGDHARALDYGLPVAGVLLAVGCALLGAVALTQWGIWLPWAAASLMAVLLAVALVVGEHAITRLQRARLSAHLSAYLPAPMAARLAAIDPSGHLEAERREVSILVADIRNFSAYAVHRPAEETAAVLHAFSCVAVEVVERHGGIVENIIGDSVVAMWNAYGPAQAADDARADHARRALAAARELLGATQELFGAAPTDPYAAPAVQPLALGVGLESGNAIVGSFGPARRRSHAALGEPVTVAVRLQAMTQDLSVPILIGPRMAACLPAGDTVSQGEYLLQGLSKHCELFAPASWTGWSGASSGLPEEPDAEREASEGLLGHGGLQAQTLTLHATASLRSRT